jgi:hypothetical protein
MSSETPVTCGDVDEHLSELLDGVAPSSFAAHLAGCERCRDARFEAERALRWVRAAGADATLASDFEARLFARLDAAAAEGAPKEQTPGAKTTGLSNGAAAEALPEALAPASALVSRPRTSQRPLVRPPFSITPAQASWLKLRMWLALAACALLLALWLGKPRAPHEVTHTTGTAVWAGKVLQVERAFGSAQGLSVCRGSGLCDSVVAGEGLEAGRALKTDGLTRALLEFEDGTRIALDRDSEFMLDPASPRRGRLLRGNLIAEVEKKPVPASAAGTTATPELAVIDLPVGRAEVLGTKFALRASAEEAGVLVSRGAVRLVDESDRSVSVLAGEAGRIGARAAPMVEPIQDLAQTFAWQDEAFQEPESAGDTSALGQLKAKKPGDDAERSFALALVQHDVKVRIVDNVARTEVEEVFSNQTGDVLEGIYRFPLPAGAQIERLALDVDGKLEEGAFVERERAAAIWRGAIVNAGGKKPPPKDDIVWVPGPWRDPALLEWQRGNRFELRVFPIPKHGTRRIVLAYTQVLPPSPAGRRYVYPLPHDPRGTTRVARFTLDAELRGHDTGSVATSGFAAKRLPAAEGVSRLAFEANDYAPSADLVVDYGLKNADAELRVWAYAGTSDSEREPPRSSPNRAYGTVPEAFGAGYVAFALKPVLPRWSLAQPRSYVLVVDSSRSMFGEHYRRAQELVSSVVAEMDRNDRVSVLACDSTCRALPQGFLTPGPEAARVARDFLRGIEPEGASDVVGAIEQALALARARSGGDPSNMEPERALRVVYVGDGTPTAGPIHPALIRRSLQNAVPAGASVHAVAVGSDADVRVLDVLSDAGGGVRLAFLPGQRARDAAYSLLGATYGQALEHASLSLPEGLVAVAPQELGTFAPGAEKLVVARLAGKRAEGSVVLRGSVAGKSFERRYPVSIDAGEGRANAFVPRLYAAVTIADLEHSMAEDARRRSIELSTRFNVASQYTSLLVLESPAMSRAFGLTPAEGGPRWTGDQESNKVETWADAQSADDAEYASADKDAPASTRGSADFGVDAPMMSLGSGGREAPRPEAKATKKLERQDGYAEAPRAAAPANQSGPVELDLEASPERSRRAEPDVRMQCECAPGDLECALRCSGPIRPSRPLWMIEEQQRMIPMRRIWERTGTVDVPARELTSPDKLNTARLRADTDTSSRNALKELYVLAFLSGDLDTAERVAELWSEKDPLDPDALTARADVAAQRGDRERAIRILGSVVDVRPGDYKPQWRLARLERWAGQAVRGCRHALAVAQLKLADAELVAEALRCSRDIGQQAWLEELSLALSPEVRSSATRLAGRTPDTSELSGDFRLEANWQGAEHDVDLVIVHPDGYRVSWLGAPTRAVISASDVLSVHREGLALRGATPGSYGLELVRSSPTVGPISGEVKVTVGKQSRRVPFTLDGERLRFASARVNLTPRLVPLER